MSLSRRHLSIRAAIIVLGVAAAGLMVWRVSHLKNAKSNAQSLPLSDYGVVQDFSLTERSGQTVTLNDLKGTPWIANFIFTRCAGPCPLMSFQMSKLQKKFLKSTDLKFVSFSVDPAFDTPAVLSDYAARYGADPKRWLFLTGESDKIYQLVLKSFRLAMEKNTDPAQAPGEQVNHSLNFVLVDSAGHINNYYNGDDRAAMERLEADLKTLTKKQ